MSEPFSRKCSGHKSRRGLKSRTTSPPVGSTRRYQCPCAGCRRRKRRPNYREPICRHVSADDGIYLAPYPESVSRMRQYSSAVCAIGYPLAQFFANVRCHGRESGEPWPSPSGGCALARCSGPTPPFRRQTDPQPSRDRGAPPIFAGLHGRGRKRATASGLLPAMKSMISR